MSAMLERMLAREPLSRIVGRREFWGLEFLLSADTLDPRPESETVVEAVLARLPERDRPYRFLDLGTGTGCSVAGAAYPSTRRRSVSGSTSRRAPPGRRATTPSGSASARGRILSPAAGRRR